MHGGGLACREIKKHTLHRVVILLIAAKCSCYKGG